jgi:hypothetical protein
MHSLLHIIEIKQKDYIPKMYNQLYKNDKRWHNIAQKEPKTLRGMERKMMTGDGRKSTPMEKAMKEMDKTMEEAVFGKKKKKAKRKK